MDKSRLLGCQAPFAGEWLNALPSTSLGLHLNDEQVRVVTGYRLGAQIFEKHICVCGAQIDVQGYHTLSCRHIKSKHTRHSLMNETVMQALKSAFIPVQVEPPGLSRDDGKRPDGLTLVPWKCGKPLVWDATCINRLAVSYANQSGIEGAKVAELAENRKVQKYEQLINNYFVIPVALETLGGFGPLTCNFIKELGRKISEKTGEPRSTSFLRQRLSMAVQLGNSACLMENLSS